MRENEQNIFVTFIIYTYTVSRVTYTDEYRACIWTSLGEFRYERYESICHTTDCISVLLSQYYEFISSPIYKVILQKLKHCQVKLFTTACDH